MRLGRTESRTLAVLLALLTAALGYVLLVHWWFVVPQQEIAAQMQSLRDDAQRYRALIAQRDTLRKRLATIEHSRSAHSAFIAGDDPSAAAAALMQRAVDAVHRHADAGPCEVTQKMPVSGDEQNGSSPYRRVRVSLSLRCGTRPLAAVLHDLETGMPYLFVDAFSAYRAPMPASQHGVPPLQVQMTVSGYIHAASAHHGGGS